MGNGQKRLEYPRDIFTCLRIYFFKLTRERYYVIDGTDCWQQCDQHGGACPQHCGPTGFCCSSTRHHVNGDCTLEMEEAIRNSIYADRENHICVARKPEETCTDWNIEYHTNCPGNDLGGSIPAPNGLDQCQDLCLQNQPECNHIALNKAKFKRNHFSPIYISVDYNFQGLHRCWG